MGREFVEFSSENGRIPYTASKLCFCLTQYAKEYIANDRKIVSKVDTNVRDAVLVDSINFLGNQGGIDFGLYTKDLYDGRDAEEYVDAQCLLTVLSNYYACYIFNEGVVESVLRNKHMNECKEIFNENDAAVVLIDFINYIAERNYYDRKFTMRDLYAKIQKQNYNRELAELKSFLELTSKYSQRLENGENIDFIFDEVAKKHDLKSISARGRYYYTTEIKQRVGQSEMLPWDKNNVEKELYAMAYAYDKLNLDNSEKPKTKIITKMIRKMKKR